MLVAAGSVWIFPSLKLEAQERRRSKGSDGDLTLVQPGQGMAASVNYHHKTSDVKDAKLKTDRQGMAFNQQRCSNCMLYSKHGMKDGSEVGKCTLFPNQVVKGEGWCSSWAKKS